MKVQILDEAEDDLIDGFRFYEEQSSGLGLYFLETLFSEIDTLERNAGIHPQHFGYYRLLSRRFPYAVYYKVENHTARIRAVVDCRRNPAWIRKRLK
jgi:plasmid stabilization system protein ParE